MAPDFLNYQNQCDHRLVVSTEFLYMDLVGFTGFQRVPVDFIGFSRIFLSVSLGFTRFHWVLLDFTGFLRVILGFIGF